MNKPAKDGKSTREHLEQVARQTGRTPQELINPTEFPSLLSYVWSAFISLNKARTAGFAGPNPITYSEIQAWMNLTDNPLKPQEVEIIKALDNTYMKVANG